VTDRDKKTGEKIINLWINFAQSGNPTPKKDLQQPDRTQDPLKGFVWEPTKKHSRK
jgi:hypothetical protein